MRAAFRRGFGCDGVRAATSHGYDSGQLKDPGWREVLFGDSYTERGEGQAAYDLRKLRGHDLVVKPGRGRRYHVPTHAARTITALLVIRQHVIEPIVAGVRSPRLGRKPAHWTAVDRDYEALRVDMQKLFDDLALTTEAA